MKTWLTMGVSLALGTAGGVLFGVASGNASEQRKELSDAFELDQGIDESDIPAIEADWAARVDAHVKPYTTSAYVLWGVGGAALVAGGVMLALDLRKTDGEVEVQSLAPMFVPGGGGFAAQFTF